MAIEPLESRQFLADWTTPTGSPQEASYRDGKEMDTNYPIVSLINGSTVTHGRTIN